MAKHPSSGPGNSVPAAVITHSLARIRGEQAGDITVYHARTDVARMDLVWDGVLLTFWSAESAQSVLEGFAAARAMLSSIPRELPPPPLGPEPFAQQTLALNWWRRATYAVIPREEMSRDNRRLLRWLDIHMGPVTWQILDQVGHKSAVRLLRRAHATAGHVFLDGPKFRADPTRDDYRPPE